MSTPKLSPNNLQATTEKQLENYSLSKIIGEGSFGTIYKAIQKSTKQVVAIKILKLPKELDTQSKKKQLLRFDRETQLCAEINHPNIVRLIDKGVTSANEPFAVFEYLLGQTLKEYFQVSIQKPLAELGELMLQVLDAIVCAHDKGIVHRDLKPQNIMVVRSGTKTYAKVLDFGIGEYTSSSNVTSSKTETISNEIVGTPAYSAPEQLRGEPTTIKSDLYSWGLILMECITGKTVMNSNHIGGILQQQLSAEEIELPQYLIDHPIAEVLKKVLPKKSILRSNNASEIYKIYSKIDLNTIVDFRTLQNLEPSEELERTIVNPFEWKDNDSEKRQITVLCIKLSLVLAKGEELDIETFDTLQKDQLNLCQDIAIRYGGFISGTLVDNTIIYFGYPEMNDNDARIAGRAALELMNEVSKRSVLLYRTHRVKLSVRMGMNTGLVLAKNNQVPQGLIPNKAFELLYKAKPNEILVCGSTKKILDSFLEFQTSKYGFSLTGELQSESLLFLNPKNTDNKMIGRETELKKIIDSWNGVESSIQGYIIAGQAGIGKSKLIYTIKQHVLLSNSIVKHAQCLPEHQNNTLYPIFEMLKKHFEIGENLKDQQAVLKLKRVLKKAKCKIDDSLPILCSWLSISLKGYQIPQLSPQEQKKLLFSVIEKIICSIGDEKKFLFIIEDLHWADSTSQLFIEYLLEKNNSNNYLILLSARPEFSFDTLKIPLDKLELSPLKKTSIKLLIEGVLEGVEVNLELANFINKQTDGIAYYAEEFTRMLFDQKLITIKNNRYQLVDKIENIEIPTTLVGLLQTRLNSLGTVLETAQLAASIGREFSYDLLVESSLKDEAIIQGDLNVLLDSNIIYKRLNVSGGGYMFIHALMRDAAPVSMTSSVQKETHKRIGFILNKRSSGERKKSIQRIAHHFYKAELFKEAIGFYAEAADLEMLKKLGHLESINLIDKGLSVVDRIKKNQKFNYDGLEEARLRVHKAAVLTNRFGWQHPEIIENYNLVEKLLKQTNVDNKLDFALAKGKWIFECINGNVTAMYNLALKMEDAAKAMNDMNSLAQAYDCLSQTQFFNGDFEGCVQSCQKCYKVYNREQAMQNVILDGLDPFIVCKSFDSLAQLFIGNVDQAFKIMDDVIKEASSYNWSNLTMGLFAQKSRLYLYFASFLPNCEYEETLMRKLNSNVDLFKQKGAFIYWESAIYLNTVSINTLLNKKDAFVQYQIARKKWAPKTSAKAYYDLIEAINCLSNKNYERVLQIAEASIEFANKNRVTFGLAYAYNFKAEALFGLGEIAEAENNFLLAIKTAQQQKAKWIELFVIKSFKKFIKKLGKDNLIHKFNKISINTKHSLTLITS